MFDDGPAPFFKRLNINSAAVEFLDLGWAESPDEKARKKALTALVESERQILFKNTKIQRMKREMPEVFDYISKNISEREKKITNKTIAAELELDNKI